MSTSLSVTPKPLNKQFLVLQAIAIILVVLGHKTGSYVNLLKFWFPIYSYHMPLFIFISGYFYSTKSEQNIPLYIWRKIKRLVLPYFCWNLVYGIIFTILYHQGIFVGKSGAEPLSLYSFFVLPWIEGGQYRFNLATWFVLSLFLVQVFYVCIRRLGEWIHIHNEYVLLLVLFIVGIGGTYISATMNNEASEANKYLSPIIKMMFFLPFFHLGFFYKTKLEKQDKLNSIAYFCILFTIQFALIQIFGAGQLSFSSCDVNFRHHLVLPFITSITGIALWLRISRILAKSIGDNGFVRYLGQHTWDVMTHHIFVFFLFNALFGVLATIGVPYLNFDFHKFQTEIWYYYTPFGWSNHFYLLPCVLGVTVPLLARKFISHTPLAKIRKFFLR